MGWSDSEPGREQRGGILHVRVPVSLKKRIRQLAEFWTERELMQVRSETGNSNASAKATSDGDVVVRLVTNGIEAVWKELGLPAKPSQEQVEALLRRLKSH
jgi:hypothetical protein